ncbi:hypothetical protein NP233_g2414 [Leucocoprinus birnbaumii]|uniref:F-box domain-containing protein n=1 Tax=Leucocoprinus birnbaumii TaxID=56174 RepID=A0AAD5YTS2_9AGAR|nr:hypothetical protein NP233_g2414 [Leucocoprinus birnbaumii]
MPHIDDFPPELLEKVAFFITDKHTLECASLVCKSWGRVFQEFLFERITMGFNPNKWLQGLYHSDPQNPSRDRLLSCVRSLFAWNGRTGKFFEYPYECYDHATINVTFLPMFQSLTNLTSICLSHAPFDYEELSISETRSVVGIFGSPILRTISVHAILAQAMFPLCILPLCPGLRTLSLIYANIDLMNGGTFPEFTANAAKLIGIYEELEGQPDKSKSSLREALLARLADTRVFTSFASANIVEINGRLELDYTEPLDVGLPPPMGPISPFVQCLENLGGNITELHLHISWKWHAEPLTRMTPNSQILANLQLLDIKISALNVTSDLSSEIAGPINEWVVPFFESLLHPERLLHLGIVYELLVSTHTQGPPSLKSLNEAWNHLDKTLDIVGLEALEDCKIALGIQESDYSTPRCIQADPQRGLIGDRVFSSMFPRLFPKLQKQQTPVMMGYLVDEKYRDHFLV